MRTLKALRLGKRSAVAAPPPAPSFSPATLFASGEKGAWYDPSDSSTVFQDAAATTPAGIGDPVGAIHDKSGNGNHWIQGTSTARPVLSRDGSGNYYLDFDGVDDGLTINAASVTLAAAAMLCSSAIRQAATAVYAPLLAGGGAYFGVADISAPSDLSPTHSNAGVPANYVNGVVVTEGRGPLAVALNVGNAVESNVPVDLTADPAWPTSWKFALYGGAMFKGRLYGLVLTTHTEKRAQIETYLGLKCGVSL